MFDVFETHPGKNNGAGTMDNKKGNHSLNSAARYFKIVRLRFKIYVSARQRIDAKNNKLCGD